MDERTILYVEDNEHNRRIVRKILEKRGFTILEADDGIRGLNAIRAHRPPLVLLDISLPGMDGIEIARRVKADEELKHIYLIALTASAMRGDRERFLAAGCDDYMSKPFKAQELIDMVEANFKVASSIHTTKPAVVPKPTGPISPIAPALPPDKLQKLEELKQQKQIDSNIENPPIPPRGTDPLPQLPEEKLRKLEELKRQKQDSLPPLEPVKNIQSTKSGPEDMTPNDRFPPVPRTTTTDDLAIPEDKLKRLEEAKRKAKNEWVVETHISDEEPANEALENTLQEAVQPQSGIKTGPLPELQDPQAEIDTGQLPKIDDPQSDIDTGELKPDSLTSAVTTTLPDLDSLEVKKDAPKAIDESIYYEKTTALPPLESVLKEKEEIDKKEASETDELKENSWLSKATQINDDESEPKESVGSKIFNSVSSNKPTETLPKLSEAESQEISEAKMEGIYDKIIDQPKDVVEEATEDKKAEGKSDAKIEGIYDKIIDEPKEADQELETGKVEPKPKKEKARPKKKTKIKAAAANGEAKAVKGKSKARSSSRKNKEIKKRISSTLMDVINVDHIDPADPDAVE